MLRNTVIFLGILSGLALVSSQQQTQPQVQAANQTCTLLNTKPVATTTKYNFSNCIVAQFAVFMTVSEGQYILLNNGVVDANLSNCQTNTTAQPRIVVNFDCAQIGFTFNHTPDQKKYVSAIMGKINLNQTEQAFTNTSENFVTSQSGHYYKCNAEQSIKTDKGFILNFSNVALEAYKTTSGNDFYDIPEECPLDSQSVSDWVRIGVGICLVALVAIVLVAYFIGRRRWSERSSYESV